MSLAQVQLCTGEAEADDERDLIERAKRDREAFAALYQHHYPMLVDYVYRRTGDVHTTEDLVADVFVIVLRSLSGYRYRGVPLRYWLLRIATRTVNRWAGRHRRRFHSPLDADQMADRVESPLGGRSEAEPVQRALLTLKPKYQAVLALYHLQGLSVRETAAVLGCREGTVRSRLARARDALRKELERRR